MDQIWDEEVSNWRFRNIERRIFLEIVKNIDGKILEVGPGYGRVLEALSGKDITGLELSENLAKKLKLRVGTHANIVVGDISNSDFESELFDAVIMEEVIEHIADQERVLSEIYRILKRGGKVVLTTPNKYIYRTLMYLNNIRKRKFSLDLLKNPTPGHISECTLGTLKGLLGDYQIEKLIGINPYFPESFVEKFPSTSIGFVVVAAKPLADSSQHKR